MRADISSDETPKAVFWFKIYSGSLCLLYLVTAAFSIYFFMDPIDTEMSETAANIAGGLMLVVSVVLFTICLLPLVLSPRPWLWTYNLVVICIGMTSACFLPVCIPLMIFWMKPETKQYFEKFRKTNPTI